MQFTVALLAVAGLAAALPDNYGYGAPKSPYQPEKDCQTSSTCKAVYKTITTDVPSQATSTVVKTVTEAVTKTTNVPEKVTVTKLIPSTYVETKTVTKTNTIPYDAFKVTTICETKTIPYKAMKTSVVTDVESKPCTSTLTKNIVTETQHPKIYTTSLPVEKKVVTVINTKSQTIITKTENECSTATSCKPNKPTMPVKTSTASESKATYPSKSSTEDKPNKPTAPVYPHATEPAVYDPKPASYN